MDNIPILLEHIHLLNRLDWLDVELLERGLQFFVVGAGGLMDFLLFPAWGAFPSMCQESVSLLFFWGRYVLLKNVTRERRKGLFESEELGWERLG